MELALPGMGLEASVKLFCLAFGTSTLLSANGERSRTIGFGCNSIIAEAAKWTEKGKQDESR